jgi:hypothetical protein
MHSNYSGLVGYVFLFSCAAMPGEYNLCMVGELCQQILTSAYYGTITSRSSRVVCRGMVRGSQNSILPRCTGHDKYHLSANHLKVFIVRFKWLNMPGRDH